MGKWNLQNVRFSTLAVAALLFLGLALFFAWLAPGYNLSLLQSAWSGFGGGGGCPNGQIIDFALYDRTGSRQDFNFTSSTYVGDAPLYQPDMAYPALKVGNPCFYPASLPTEVVLTWPEVYPLSIQVQPPSFLSGESKNLEVKMSVATKFTGKSYQEEFPVVIQPGEKVPVAFLLNAANFVFSPLNDPAATKSIQIASTVTQRWSISPLEKAVGEQSINVEVSGLENAYTGASPFAVINVNVQPRDELPTALRSFLIGLGISPARLALLSSFAAILVALLAAAKSGLELYKTWQDVRQAHNASTAKPAPKAKPKSGKPKARR